MDDAYLILAVWFTAVAFFAVVIIRLATKKRVTVEQHINGWAEKIGVRLI